MDREYITLVITFVVVFALIHIAFMAGSADFAMSHGGIFGGAALTAAITPAILRMMATTA